MIGFGSLSTNTATAQVVDPVYVPGVYVPPPHPNIMLSCCCPPFCSCPDCGCACCAITAFTHATTQAVIANEHRHLTETVFGNSAGILNVLPVWQVPAPPPGVNRLQTHERWLLTTFWWQYLQPALMMMTEQLVTTQMNQMMIIGSFIDARVQLDTQRLFQKKTAEAHKDYHPSFGMCEIGSNTRSLAAANFNSDLTQMVLNKQFLDRQLGNGSSVGASGPESDRASTTSAATASPHNRLGYFLNNTCDRWDLNHVLGSSNTGLWLCPAQPRTQGWVNRDIDWQNTVMGPRTINVDFTTTAAESASDNERLFQFSNYLYGHKVFPRIDGTLLASQKNVGNFLDSRSVTAKRSVGQNSFNNIVGLKTRGTRLSDPAGASGSRAFSAENTFEFMNFFMVELGLPPADPAAYRTYLFQKNEAMEPPGAADSERNEISYYAQMEMLAKKIYQRPEFYTQLYDKPANTKRKSAAMQAIKVMLERDIFESQLRSEAIMSMILELKVIEEQQNIESKLGLMRERTR